MTKHTNNGDDGGLETPSPEQTSVATKQLTSMEAYKAVFGAIYNVEPEVIEMLLWEETAFPACGIRHATKQLVDYFEAATLRRTGEAQPS